MSVRIAPVTPSAARAATGRPASAALLLVALALGAALPLAAQDADSSTEEADPTGERGTDEGADTPASTDAGTAAEAGGGAGADGISDYVAPALRDPASPPAAADTAPIELEREPRLPDGVLATVNERPVPELSLENIVRQLSAEGEAPDRERILDELIDLEILTQEAEKMALDRRPEIAAALQLQYTQTMANAYLAAVGDEMQFSEAELRAEYDRQTANIDAQEFRASHILLDSEADARAVIDELADGADFAALAKARSTDPAGQSDGGDLGWFQSASMAPEFAAAVESLEVGENSEEPVKTDFGYHVILLVDRRGAALPDYESVKPGLTDLVLRNRLAARVEELRESADVERR